MGPKPFWRPGSPLEPAFWAPERCGATSEPGEYRVTVTIDHLVWGAADLDGAVADLADRTGGRGAAWRPPPRPGHRQRAHGPGRRHVPGGDGPRPRRCVGSPWGGALTGLDGPRLVAWLARTTDAEASAAAVRDEGVAGDRHPPVARDTRGRAAGVAPRPPGRPRRRSPGPDPHRLGRHHPPRRPTAPAGVELVSFHVGSPDPGPLRARPRRDRRRRRGPGRRRAPAGRPPRRRRIGGRSRRCAARPDEPARRVGSAPDEAGRSRGGRSLRHDLGGRGRRGR